ncbi:DNA translocase FtsK [Peribacillus asahii]|uniref:DNA translocase FtsK n=1 Tax=Peribacillus asahii TaxID=228899 RepID=UPI0037F1391F
MKNWFLVEETVEIEEIVIDEEPDFDEVKNREAAKLQREHIQEKQTLQRKSTSMNDPDTKVLYQYPKGQFKFPLIPDEEPLPRRKIRNNRVKDEARMSEKVPVQEKPNQKFSDKATRPVHHESELKAVTPKKPFRPTEIPSPIYGFHRPQKQARQKEEVVEFELETTPESSYQLERESEIPVLYRKSNTAESIKPRVMEEEAPVPVQPAVVAEEKVEPASFNHLKKESEIPVVYRKRNVEESIEPPVMEEEAPEVIQLAVVTEERVEPASSNHLEKESEIPAVYRKSNVAESIEPRVMEEEAREVVQPVVVAEERVEPASSNHLEKESEIPAVYRKSNVQESIEPLVMEEEASVLVQPAVVAEEKVEPASFNHLEKESEIPAVYRKSNVQESIEPPVMEEEAREVVQPAVVAEEKVEPAAADTRVGETKKEQPRKKHIPFNVVMLKQDQKRMNFPSYQGTDKKVVPATRSVVPKTASPTPNIEEKPKMEATEVASAEEEATIIQLVPDTVVEVAPIVENIVETEHVEQADTSIGTDSSEEIEENPYYMFPDIELLTPSTMTENDDEWLEEQMILLNETLKNFNVRAKVVNVTQGPAVTQFEVYPEPGVKVSKVTNLMDDIKLSLAAQDMRMEAPIPGKHTIGIEIPNRKSKPVFLREVLESDVFQNHPSPLAVVMGLDIAGQPIVTDLRKMPHGLIAGQTGSGKSVCINTMLVSLLYKATPQELKLMLIDPKMVELAPYNRIPHLVSPVITDVKAATAALKWAVEEMERRYELFVHAGVRDITKFNEQAELARQYSNKLPYIVIIIDELADLMMMSPADVEEAICRIAQKARACGIHLIVATQRPSVDVITGLIKANIPTRVAFSVSSQVDSRTIIDSGGAEKLLGRGDMLFAENGSSKTVRLQGTFVSDDEIDQVVNHVKNEQQPNYLFEQEDLLSRAQVTEDTDELFLEACEFVVSQHAASASSIQRRFRVGYNRAARLVEMMEQQGIISESRGSKPREVLISEEELEFLLDENSTNH